MNILALNNTASISDFVTRKNCCEIVKKLVLVSCFMIK